MPDRAAKFVPALLASLLGLAALTAASHGAPTEAEKCLTGPQGAVPEGGHWYYRIERATKRHCWYIGDAKQKVAHAAPANSSASADPAPPPKDAAAKRAIADARAELQPQTRAEPAIGITRQRTAAAPANTAGTDTRQRAGVSDTNTQSSVIASRWPEPSGVSPSASQTPAPPPATYQSAATVQGDATPVAAPAVAPVTLAAADSSAARQTGSIQTLLIAIVGALSLAGLIGSAIFRFGSMRRRTGGRDARGVRRDRRAIWDSVSPSPMAYPISDASRPTAHIRREKTPPVADDPNRRITEMLAQLSRTSVS